MGTEEKSPTKVYRQEPCAPLRPFVRHFLVVDSSAPHADTHLPDVGAVAAFTFRGRCRIDESQWAPPAAFTGIHDARRAHEHLDRHSAVLVIFEPMGAAAFLRPSMEEFSRATADLADLLGDADELDRLHERLARAPNHARRVILVETFLLKQLRTTAPDPLVTAAVQWLDRPPGAKRIEHLTGYIGLSQSALERRFRRTVGLSPKKFAAVVRFRHAVRLMGAGHDLATVAQTAGYFDQSHFIHDFRRSAGTAPSAYLRSAPTIQRA